MHRTWKNYLNWFGKDIVVVKNQIILAHCARDQQYVENLKKEEKNLHKKIISDIYKNLHYYHEFIQQSSTQLQIYIYTLFGFFSLYIFTKKLSIFLPQKIEKILWWILIIYNTKRFIVLYCENENKKVVIKTKLYETCQCCKIIVNEGIKIHFLFWDIKQVLIVDLLFILTIHRFAYHKFWQKCLVHASVFG